MAGPTTYRNIGHWQQTDRYSGKIVSGATFTCPHCGDLVDIIPKAPLNMCHHEWLPVCDKCHAIGTCPASQARLNFLEWNRKYDEQRAAMLKEIGVEGA